MNKKLLSYLLTFVLLLLPVSVTVASAAPASYAPEYTFSIGYTAAGKDLYDPEEGFESGMFALVAQISNAPAALGGTFVIKYDTTKVKPMYYKKTTPNKGWNDVTDGIKAFLESEWSGDIASSNRSGAYVDGENGYVYANWYAADGEFDAEALVEEGMIPELGAFAFETLDGVTAADFDKNTFVLVTDTLEEGNPIRTELASLGSPVTCNVKVEGTEKPFGISDYTTREAMAVRFVYPNVNKVQKVPADTTEPEEPETFDVVFMANDAVITTITKKVGETVTVAEFPTDVVAPEGYKFIGWDVTADITAATTVNAVFEKIDTTPRTVSAVTKAGTTCTVTTDLLYIPEGAVILVAGYNGKEMVAFEKVNYTKAQEIFNLAAEVEIEKVKVMVWANTSATAAPITIAEVK